MDIFNLLLSSFNLTIFICVTIVVGILAGWLYGVLAGVVFLALTVFFEKIVAKILVKRQKNS